MSKPRTNVVTGTCAYCGANGEVEDDHLIPQSLFLHQNQATITVPACHECNGAKGEGEGDLRDLMVLAKRHHTHPTADKLLPIVQKATRKGNSRVGQAAQEARYAPYYTEAGIYLGHENTVDLPDMSRLRQSLLFLIRGLHYFELGLRFPAEAPHQITFIPYHQFGSTIQEFSAISRHDARVVSNREFWWVPFHTPGSIAIIYWLMCFYDGQLVVGVTGMNQYKAVPTRSESIHRTILRKGRREKGLKRIIERGLIMPPPENTLTFIQATLESGKESPALLAGLLRHDRS